MLFSAFDMRVPEASVRSKETQRARERAFQLLLTPRAILSASRKMTTTIASLGASNTQAAHSGKNSVSVRARGPARSVLELLEVVRRYPTCRGSDLYLWLVI